MNMILIEILEFLRIISTFLVGACYILPGRNAEFAIWGGLTVFCTLALGILRDKQMSKFETKHDADLAHKYADTLLISHAKELDKLNAEIKKLNESNQPTL